MTGLAGLALAALLAVMPLAPAFAADPVVGTCGAPGAPAGPQIQVVVTGARKVAGNITFTLYGPRPEAFLARGGRIGRQRITMRGPQTEACFAVSAPGSYAIAVYQDENNDHKFDRTVLGMPAEGYGFSNDAPAVLGLPSYESARFQVGAAGARLPIALRY
jgi:uncharacterized protein (DUF2141 family)